MKRRFFHTLLLITLLASLAFGTLGQATEVHAAPVDLDLLPDGPGDYTAIGTLVGAATNWEAVDDPVATPDDATTYVEVTAKGTEKDAYTLQDAAVSGTINSVTVYFRVAVNNNNKIHYYQPFLRLAGAETTGTQIQHTTTTWTAYSEVLVNPDLSGGWTWADINNLQVAIQLTDNAAGEPELTQIYVRVNYTPPAPDIANTPTSYPFGTVAENSTTATGLTYFTVTNNSGFAVNITIGCTDMTGGTTWTLSDTATPGSDTYGLNAGISGSYNIIVRKTGPFNALVSGLADSGTQTWGLQLLAPTSFGGGGANSATVTLTATQV